MRTMNKKNALLLILRHFILIIFKDNLLILTIYTLVDGFGAQLNNLFRLLNNRRKKEMNDF